MNSVHLIGRLTRDPEIRYTSGSQMAVASFTIAIDRITREGEERKADFPRITVFGKQAENCERFLAKGRKVAIEGRIQTGSYQDKDGKTVYTTDVVANRVEFLEWGDRPEGQSMGARGGQGQFGGNQYGGQPQQAAPSANQFGGEPEQPRQEPAGSQSGPGDEMPGAFEEIEEDLPF